MSALYVVCYHSGPEELFLIWLGPVSYKAIKVIKMEQNLGGCRKDKLWWAWNKVGYFGQSYQNKQINFWEYVPIYVFAQENFGMLKKNQNF